MLLSNWDFQEEEQQHSVAEVNKYGYTFSESIQNNMQVKVDIFGWEMLWESIRHIQSFHLTSCAFLCNCTSFRRISTQKKTKNKTIFSWMCAFNSKSNSFETVKEGKSFANFVLFVNTLPPNKGGPMRNNVGNRFINYSTT